MSRNWINFYVDGAVHHVTGTVHQWQPLLLFPKLTELIYDEMADKLKIWNVKLWAYVIMPEHFHLLVEAEKGVDVERFIHGFRRSISGKVRSIISQNEPDFRAYCALQRIDARLFYRKTAGKSAFRLWKEKPRVFPMDREKDVVRILKYIHHNPARRGLVECAEDWEHSSFRFYELGEKCRLPVKIDLRTDI